MKKAELMELVGRYMEVVFHDERVEKGILGYANEFSAKHGWRKPDYFYINDISFKVSHIKRIKH